MQLATAFELCSDGETHVSTACACGQVKVLERKCAALTRQAEQLQRDHQQQLRDIWDKVRTSCICMGSEDTGYVKEDVIGCVKRAGTGHSAALHAICTLGDSGDAVYRQRLAKGCKQLVPVECRD